MLHISIHKMVVLISIIVHPIFLIAGANAAVFMFGYAQLLSFWFFRKYPVDAQGCGFTLLSNFSAKTLHYMCYH